MGDERDGDYRKERGRFLGITPKAPPQPDLFAAPAPAPKRPDMAAGWDGAAKGMNRAAEHAERISPEWSARAALALASYARAHPGEEFVAPVVRAWAEARGLDPPVNNRAWGGVFQSAARSGVIEKAGFQLYGDAEMHTQAVVKWRKGEIAC